MGEGWLECTGTSARMRPTRRRLRRRIDAAFAAAQQVICVSEPVYAHMQAIGVPIRRAAIIPNPIDDLFFRERHSDGPEHDVAVLARPSRAKSPITALRVLAAANRYRLSLRMVWIGPLGRWDLILSSLATLMGLRRLTFAGQLSREKVCDVLDATNLLLSASNREGEPLSVLEALSRGCSALLSDIPGHRPFAADAGVRLFSLADPSQAGRLLLSLLDEHVPTRRPYLREHSVEAHGRRLLELYERVSCV